MQRDYSIGDAAKVNNPETWGSFENAIASYRNNNFNGISFIFTKEDPFVGIDFDDCFIGEKLSPEIEELVQKIGSYTEISPSGNGLHVIIKGQLPAGGLHNKKIEIYDMVRAFTFTGDILPSAPARVADGSTIIDYLLKTYFPKPESTSFPCSDLGNAERLANHYGDRLKYCHLWNKLVIWDGTKWSEDGTGKINQLAKKTVRKIYQEAKQSEVDNKHPAIAKHALSSESNGRIKSMVSLARSELPVTPDQFDQDRFLLNCKNGTIDLSTRGIAPHDKDKFITKVAPVLYNKTAAYPQWDKFLNRIMDNNQDLIKFLQRAIGYSLTEDVSEQCLFLLWGTGENGKSTFLRTIGNILGDYSQHTPTETLVIKK